MATLVNDAAAAPPGLEPIRPFSDLSAADVPYAGGKGANLGELTRAGLPVPPGFVVGAPACAAFRAETPRWLTEAIGAAYDELCLTEPDVAVAVRSSATGEDTASASFAGMNESFLNVRGREAVIAAVRRLSESETDVAIVVQRQVPSTRAGVMFTVDPATGERDHLVIEGSFGLGESVVSGQVSPDRYVVEKSSMSVVVRSVRPKELTIEVVPDGGTVSRELNPEESRRPVLSDDEVLRVAELGVALEREFGAPQDIEWAFDPENFVWMLQSRPIMTIGAPAIAAARLLRSPDKATKRLRDGELVSVDAALDGRVMVAPGVITGTRLLVNLSEPSQVDQVATLDVDGVGLIRAELMLVEALEGVHPRKLLAGGRGDYIVQRLSAGLLTFATGFAPRPVTYRTTDVPTSDLDLFGLELDAIERVWEAGHTNVHVMLPFVRAARELPRCRDLLDAAGLLGRPGFELWVMAGGPSVLSSLARYASLGIAGISIGSDERPEYLSELMPRARAAGLQTSICGPAAAVYLELLVRAGLDAISVAPDAVERTRRLIAATEKRLLLEAAQS